MSAQQRHRWKELTEKLLPERARREGWPVRLDHCFKRISLDAAFCDVWYRHLARPAEQHIEGEALARAVDCAEKMLASGVSTLRAYNAASLRYRGKKVRITETYDIRRRPDTCQRKQ